jgi:GLPGLI family protein
MQDSSKIYAWFSNEILPSVGPEGFCGLPGAILGLATEDGGVIYFAKTVTFNEVKESALKINYKTKNMLTRDQFEEKMNQLLGDIKEDIIYRMNLTKWM